MESRRGKVIEPKISEHIKTREKENIKNIGIAMNENYED